MLVDCVVICHRDSFFFLSYLTFFILNPLFLSSSVSLSYFVLAEPMRVCLGKHPCMTSTFPIAIGGGWMICHFSNI